MAAQRVALEELEVRLGEHRVIQNFAAQATSEDPTSPLASGLDLVVNQELGDNQPPGTRKNSSTTPWQEYYSDPSVKLDQFPNLDAIHQDLAKQWLAFQQQLEEEQREKDEKWHSRIRRRLKGKEIDERPVWHVSSTKGQPLGIQDILTSARDAQQFWQSKSRLAQGKPQNYFHKFCRSLDAHSNFLKIPEQNQYLSAFCGATIVLIKASVNHQNVAQRLDEALTEISGPIMRCQDHVKLMNTKDMHKAIAYLYSEVFRFLRSAMKWYQDRAVKKVLNSLNQNLADDLKNHVVKIKDICDSICKDSMLKTQAELRDLHLRFKQAEEDKIAREQQQQSMAQDQIPQAKLKELGLAIARNLQAHQKSWLHEDIKHIQRTPTSGLSARRLTEEIDHRASRKRKSKRQDPRFKVNRKDLQRWSRDMEDFTTNVPSLMNLIDFDMAVVEVEVLETIQGWIRSPSSQALWIQGTYQEMYPSYVTAIAARILDVAIDWSIPALYGFSNTSDDENDVCESIDVNPDNTPAENIVIDLVYSLVRQLIIHIPSEIRTTRAFSKEHFDRYDGSIQTFNSAFKLFRELFQHAPTNLYIILDGIERLDGTPSEEMLLDLLLFIQHAITESDSRRVIKVLYTTAGSSDTLGQLDEDLMFSVEARDRRAKRANRSMLALSQLNLESDGGSLEDASNSE